jgi:hypothetical protein
LRWVSGLGFETGFIERYFARFLRFNGWISVFLLSGTGVVVLRTSLGVMRDDGCGVCLSCDRFGVMRSTDIRDDGCGVFLSCDLFGVVRSTDFEPAFLLYLSLSLFMILLASSLWTVSEVFSVFSRDFIAILFDAFRIYGVKGVCSNSWA